MEVLLERILRACQMRTIIHQVMSNLKKEDWEYPHYSVFYADILAKADQNSDNFDYKGEQKSII